MFNSFWITAQKVKLDSFEIEAAGTRHPDRGSARRWRTTSSGGANESVKVLELQKKVKRTKNDIDIILYHL